MVGETVKIYLSEIIKNALKIFLGKCNLNCRTTRQKLKNSKDNAGHPGHHVVEITKYKTLKRQSILK